MGEPVAYRINVSTFHYLLYGSLLLALVK